jgi:NodT family efflux transporter outer membrane factor (OMF) lipoprotein
MTPQTIKSLLIAMPVVLLSACVGVPKDAPRNVPIDPAGLGLSEQHAPAVSARWWQAFGDPQLNGLVEQALANSPTLADAMARLRQAQAVAQAAGAGPKPGFSIDGTELRQRFSENDVIPPPYGGGVYWRGDLGLNLSWDLDFWGRQAALIEQAQAHARTATLGIEAARLALAGAIAQAYVDLYRACADVDIAARTEQQRQDLARLTRDRVAAGLDTELAQHTLDGLVEQSKIDRERAQLARELAVHRLAALTGAGAGAYAGIGRPQLQLDTALPLPQALPLDLLSRRPDVLAARAEIEAADAGRAAARAAFYPDINLRASAGFAAIGLDQLFDSGSATYGGGPAIHLPVFDSQRLKAGYRGANAEYDRAVAHYNQTVLDAVREVADRLSQTDSLQRQHHHSQQVLAAAERAYQIAQSRYSAGLSDQLVVLNAESQLLAARREWIAIQAGQAVARVSLLLTVGGSFAADAVAASSESAGVSS